MSAAVWHGHAPRECDGELNCEHVCQYPGQCHAGGCGQPLDSHALEPEPASDFHEAAEGLRKWLEHQSHDLPRGGWLWYTSRVYLGDDGSFRVENESLLPAYDYLAVSVTLTRLIREHLEHCHRTVRGVDCPDLTGIVVEWARKIAREEKAEGRGA